jgi:hypothetical protein
LHATSDFGFAHTGAMQFPDFRSVYGRRCWPPQPFPVLPCMGQASPSSFLQNLPLEGGENGEHFA